MPDKNAHQTTPNGTDVKPRLFEMHYKALEYRYGGFTYKEIAEALNKEYPKMPPPYERIKKWFEVGGIVEQPYIDYAKKENDRRRQHLRQKMEGLLTQLPDKFRELINERFVINPFSGEVIKDEKGKPIPKRDKVLLDALNSLAAMMGFKIEQSEGEAEEDPVDRFFRLAEEKAQAEKHAK